MRLSKGDPRLTSRFEGSLPVADCYSGDRRGGLGEILVITHLSQTCNKLFHVLGLQGVGLGLFSSVFKLFSPVFHLIVPTNEFHFSLSAYLPRAGGLAVSFSSTFIMGIKTFLCIIHCICVFNFSINTSTWKKKK